MKRRSDGIFQLLAALLVLGAYVFGAALRIGFIVGVVYLCGLALGVV